MAVPTQDFVGDFAWEQGEDHVISLQYDDSETVLSADTHAVRMDVVPILEGGVLGSPVITINSHDNDESTTDEVSFGPNNEIIIQVPRSATIGPGAPKMEKKVAMYMYDVFLRNIADNKQRKILQGRIAINRSVTHWND